MSLVVVVLEDEQLFEPQLSYAYHLNVKSKELKRGA